MPRAYPRPLPKSAAAPTKAPESPPPANRPHLAALNRAISVADAATLRTALSTLCRVDEGIEKAAALLLLVPAAAPNSSSRKRKSDSAAMEVTARYEVCATCDTTFDVLKNGPEACQTHDGELEIDEEFFPDDDEIDSGSYTVGAIGEDWRIDHCPEGFTWNCCDRTTHEEKCVKKRHIAKT